MNAETSITASVHAVDSHHQRLRLFLWIWLAISLFLVFALGLGLGSVRIPLGDVVYILSGSADADASWRRIVLLYRLPRALPRSWPDRPWAWPS
jgi:ABC-type Fe3+-siderophore transport system permease subunit